MKRSVLFILALIIGWSDPVSAQTGDDALRLSRRQPITSPVSVGLAGAGNAGLGTFGDLFQNPAGLGLMKRSSFDVGMTTMSATDDAVYSIGSTNYPLSTDQSQSVLNHLSWAYKFPTARGSLVVAAGFSRQSRFDREMSYDGLNPSNSITDYFMPIPGEFELLTDAQGVYPDFNRTLSFIAFETYAIDLDQDAVAAGDAVPFLPAVTTGTVSQSGVVSDKGGISELSFGGSVEASKGVLVGLSLNIPFGSYEYLRIHDEADINDDNNGAGGTVDFQSLTFIESFTSHVAGVNVRAGLSAAVMPGLRLGLTVESPSSLSISEDYDTQLSTRFDNGDQYSYGLKSSEDAGRGTFDYTVTTPWRLGAGLSYENGPITVYGDATVVDWSALELSSDTYAFIDENLETRQAMETTISTRFGVSFQRDALTLRGGVGFEPDPHAELIRDVDRSRTYFGAGMSYAINSQFGVDLGWSMERFDDAFNPYVEVDGAPSVSEQVARHFVQVGLRMSF